MPRLALLVILVLLPACGSSPTAPDPTPAPSPSPAPAPAPVNPLFTQTGRGNTVFDMPSYVNRVTIRGVWDGTSTSNFIVRRNGQTFVNEILRDMPNRTYTGTHLVTGGGVIEIVNSAQIDWTLTEVR